MQHIKTLNTKNLQNTVSSGVTAAAYSCNRKNERI